MAPEQEITNDRKTESTQADLEFLYGLDTRLRDSYIAYMKTGASIKWFMTGDVEGLGEARRQYGQKMKLDPEDFTHLSVLEGDNGTTIRGLARKLRTQFSVRDNKNHDASLTEWRSIRAHVHYGELVGAETLKKALTRDDPAERKAIYAALHANNEALAELFLNRWRHKLQQTGETEEQRIKKTIQKHDETAQNHGYIVQLVEDTRAQLTSLINDQDLAWQSIAGTETINDHDVLYWADKIKNMHTPRGEHRKPTEYLVMTIQALRHEDLFKNITLLCPPHRHDIARHITKYPGRESVVIAYTEGSVDTQDTAQLFHETGHGMHNVGMSKDISFVDALLSGPWHEAMAFLYEDLLLEPGIGTNDRLSNLRSSVMCQRLESLRKTLLKLDLDFILRSDASASLEVLTEKTFAVFKRHFPIVDNVHPYWWANDMYVVEYPFYGINYLYGWMVAAQIRAWWDRTHTEPILSKAFGDFLRQTCYPPGASIPWREQLHNTTGEHINPAYLIAELSQAKKLLDEVISAS